MPSTSSSRRGCVPLRTARLVSHPESRLARWLTWQRTQADDELDLPYLAGFEWDKEESWTRLVVHLRKDAAGGGVSSKKKKKAAAEE